VRAPVRVAPVVIGVAVAALAGGCRQLFGIDDTDVAADAVVMTPDAPRIDGTLPADCAGDHVLCMNFDTQATGIDQLPFEQANGMGDILESDAMDAPSPPRVLVASSPADSAIAGIFRAQQFSPDIVDSPSMAFWLRVSDSVMEDCNPGLLVLAWSLADPSYQVSLAVNADGLELRVDASGVSQVNGVLFERDQWIPVRLDVSLTTGKVTLETALGTTSIDAPELSDAQGMALLFAIGISVEAPHGDCAVEYDDFTLDSSSMP
jgi:hypothetical protein